MQSGKSKRILITGGHFTPAIAVLEELKKKGFNNFVWVGHKFTMLRDSEPSAEYKEIKKLDIPFFNLITGKIYRYFSPLAIISFIRIPIGFIQSLFILLINRPSIIISFGGYIAVPVVINAKILKIPVITHEQTATVGLSNKILAKYADKILISFKSSEKHFPKSKTIFTGNPIRKDIFTNDKKFVDFDNTLPTILILGGNQGSHILNIAVMEILPEISVKANIIHQCGSNSIVKDYEKLFPLTEQHLNYKVYKGIWGEDMGRAINQANIVISRSGANTVYELIALKKPSILVPLSYAVNNEQYKNALILKDLGIGQIIEEKDLTKNNLITSISTAFDISNKIKTDSDFNKDLETKTTNTITLDAAERIADIVVELVK